MLDAALERAIVALTNDDVHVPVVVVDQRLTLSAIARERPASADALAKISGVVQSKLKRYGADVLKVVRAN